MPIDSHSEAGRGDLKSAKYLRQEQLLKFQCQQPYFILDKPESGLNIQNTGIVL